MGIPREGFDYVTIGFYAVDNLGNQIKIDYSRDTKEYLFDNGNTIFSGYGSINSDAGHEMLYPYEDSVELYFSSTYLIQKNPSEDLYITFNNYDPIYSEYQLQLESCYDMNLNKEIIISAQNATDDPRNIVVCLNPTDSSGAFVPGYYRIRFYVEVNNDTYYSQYFYIYVSENQEQENTPNYLELEKQYVDYVKIK